MNVHPVAALIDARRREGSRPGQRGDPHKLALAIEGGCMRGVVCGGMVTALEAAGLLEVFDCVYGSSAGAVTGAYFLAGQAAYGTTIFYENINNRRFIDRARLLTGRPVVSVDFLIDTVCREQKPLDTARVLASPSPLHVVASRLDPPGEVDFSAFADAEALFEALRAGARIPRIAGGPVRIGGADHVDASLFESIPYRSAAAGGATHVLALLSRPKGPVPAESERYERWLVAPWLRRIDPALARACLAQAATYAAEVAALDKGERTGDGPPYLLPIRVDAGRPAISQTETRRDRLVAGAMDGFRAVWRALIGETPQTVEVIRPFATGRTIDI